MRAEKPQFIWCAWEQFEPNGQMLRLLTEPKTLYVFEDLVAYHFWFADSTETIQNFQDRKMLTECLR